MGKKFNELVPKSKSKFYNVRCPDCGNMQIIFSHASTSVHCFVCGKLLASPTGGEARIEAKKVGEFG
ncbi:MAG: 30S ribosomal protein S27e [Candidatus Nezhaarchaeota archaeon]|nr:30S ribosomal protein S27e [Candidatus Nezhaarchaeota archaeon]